MTIQLNKFTNELHNLNEYILLEMSDLVVFQLIQTYLAETTTNEQSDDILDKIVSTLKRARLALNTKLKVEPVVDDDSNKENEPPIELIAVESIDSLTELKPEPEITHTKDEQPRKRRKKTCEKRKAAGDHCQMQHPRCNIYDDLPQLEEPTVNNDTDEKQRVTIVEVGDSRSRRRDGTRGLTSTWQCSDGNFSGTGQHGTLISNLPQAIQYNRADCGV